MSVDFDYVGYEFAKLAGSTEVRVKVRGDKGETHYLNFPAAALDKLAAAIRTARKAHGLD
jgi:hypothetical protein